MKRRYKKIVKPKDETKVKDGTEELSSTEDENGDGQSSDTHNDQDSNISFDNDTDDEMDTTEVEGENWIDYTKKVHTSKNAANLKAAAAPRSAHRMSQGCRRKQMVERNGPEHPDG